MTIIDILLFAYFYITFLFGFWFYREKHMREWTPYDQEHNRPVFTAFIKSAFSCWWYWPLMIVYTGDRWAKEKKIEDEKVLRDVLNTKSH